jgi:hypothetical protein
MQQFQVAANLPDPAFHPLQLSQGIAHLRLFAMRPVDPLAQLAFAQLRRHQMAFRLRHPLYESGCHWMHSLLGK